MMITKFLHYAHTSNFLQGKTKKKRDSNVVIDIVLMAVTGFFTSFLSEDKKEKRIVRRTDMDWHFVQKILVVLVVIITIWLNFRTQKRTQNADPIIAKADERERYVWRYTRWAALAMQIIFYVWLLSKVISFILT